MIKDNKKINSIHNIKYLISKRHYRFKKHKFVITQLIFLNYHCYN